MGEITNGGDSEWVRSPVGEMAIRHLLFQKTSFSFHVARLVNFASQPIRENL